VQHVCGDEQTAGEPHRKSKKINKGDKPVFQQVPDGNFDIIEFHGQIRLITQQMFEVRVSVFVVTP
jgi:hypothetical protein